MSAGLAIVVLQCGIITMPHRSLGWSTAADVYAAAVAMTA